MNLNERLIQLRTDRGWTQIQVSEKLDVKRARYNAWERGLSQPNTEMMGKIADVYNVSVDYLIGRSELRNAELELKEDREEDIRVINRAASQMTPEQRKEAIQMWGLLFKEEVSNAKKQEGADGNGEKD